MGDAAPTPGTLRCPVCGAPLESQAHTWKALRSYHPGEPERTFASGVIFRCVAAVRDGETSEEGGA